MVDPVQSPPKRKVLSLTPASLGIQSYYQMMIRVSNHPPKRFFEFRFHETILSFGEPGSLGIHLNTKKKHTKKKGIRANVRICDHLKGFQNEKNKTHRDSGV